MPLCQKMFALGALLMTAVSAAAVDRIAGKPFATRSEVIAPHAMAATSHPLATQIALDVMKQGGSAVDAAIAPSGQASADYTEHGRRARGMRVSQWLSVYGSDKVSVHNYGSFYDDLFERLKPQALLEIGVYRGQSLQAWRAAGLAS